LRGGTAPPHPAHPDHPGTAQPDHPAAAGHRPPRARPRLAGSQRRPAGRTATLTTAERHTAISPTPANWSFLTSHARVLLCIAHDPGMRLRDIAARLGITERSAYGIVAELAQAGYVVKQKDGRRNRYQIQTHLPLPEPTSRKRTVGDILALLAGADTTP
jgi:MarR family